MTEIITAENLGFQNFIFYPVITIRQGVFTFITGESGCGKSSLFRLLNATEIPSKGDIIYRDKSIGDYDILAYRRKVLLVPQEVYLLDGNIRENFAFYYNSLNEKIPTDDTIQTLLRTCQLDFHADTNCTTLSGGERQRVFLSIFLSFTPDVLLLDEPTAALDEKTAIQLLSRLKEYGQLNGITLTAICHSAELVSRFADCVIELGKGERL